MIALVRQQAFWLVLPFAVAFVWWNATSMGVQNARLSEAALLIDLAIVLPAAHALIYWKRLPQRTVLLRSGGLAGLGAFAASLLYAGETSVVLDHLARGRAWLMVPILLFEAYVFIVLLRVAFDGCDESERVDAIEERFAVPSWLARLLVWEADFWRGVRRLVLKLLRGR